MLLSSTFTRLQPVSRDLQRPQRMQNRLISLVRKQEEGGHSRVSQDHSLYFTSVMLELVKSARVTLNTDRHKMQSPVTVNGVSGSKMSNHPNRVTNYLLFLFKTQTQGVLLFLQKILYSGSLEIGGELSNYLFRFIYRPNKRNA